MSENSQDLITLTADIVAAHVSNNSVSISDIPTLVSNVHSALAALQSSSAQPAVDLVPAVPIRQSVKPDYIICLEDGKKLKMLKRHLMTHYGLSPDEYRTKWGLDAKYPMVCPNYAKKRSDLAKNSGLGKDRGSGRRTSKQMN